VYLTRFQLHRPGSLGEAFELRRRYGEEAAYYAGGTELLLAMKLGLARFAHLIDLKRIPGVGGIELAGAMLRIGATVTHHQLERDQTLRSHIPALAELEANVANIRVRVAGTLAGNLAFADPRADPPALLVALGARLRLASPQGETTCSLGEFFRGPLETVLEPLQVVVAVEVPLPEPGVTAAYINFKLLERPSLGVAVVGRVEAGRLAQAPTVVIGAVDVVPRPVPAAGLAGAGLDDADALQVLARAAQEAVSPTPDLAGSADYKRHLTGVLAVRAVRRLLEEAA
jgi:carbon-monoxide dehydrogenase medium subunit